VHHEQCRREACESRGHGRLDVGSIEWLDSALAQGGALGTRRKETLVRGKT